MRAPQKLHKKAVAERIKYTQELARVKKLESKLAAGPEDTHRGSGKDSKGGLGTSSSSSSDDRLSKYAKDRHELHGYLGKESHLRETADDEDSDSHRDTVRSPLTRSDSQSCKELVPKVELSILGTNVCVSGWVRMGGCTCFAFHDDEDPSISQEVQ